MADRRKAATAVQSRKADSTGIAPEQLARWISATKWIDSNDPFKVFHRNTLRRESRGMRFIVKDGRPVPVKKPARAVKSISLIDACRLPGWDESMLLLLWRQRFCIKELNARKLQRSQCRFNLLLSIFENDQSILPLLLAVKKQAGRGDPIKALACALGGNVAAA